MQKNIKILKQLIDQTDAKVVLSSTWRRGWKHLDVGMKKTEFAKDFIELRNKLGEFGIELYGKTPIFDRFMRRRGDEIKAYLDDTAVTPLDIFESIKLATEHQLQNDTQGDRRLERCTALKRILMIMRKLMDM